MDPANRNRRNKLPVNAKTSVARAARSVAALLKERARLEEEVRQLRAAVKVYAELAERAAAQYERSVSTRPAK
jgi:hypothetical protein